MLLNRIVVNYINKFLLGLCDTNKDITVEEYLCGVCCAYKADADERLTTYDRVVVVLSWSDRKSVV